MTTTTGIQMTAEELNKLEICANKGAHVSRESFLALIAQARASLPSTEFTDKQQEALRDTLSEVLGGAMDCTRAWSAWGTGNMSESDFQLIGDNDERLDELVCAIEFTLYQHPAASLPTAAAPAGLSDLESRLRAVASADADDPSKTLMQGLLREAARGIADLRAQLAAKGSPPATQQGDELDSPLMRVHLEHMRHCSASGLESAKAAFFGFLSSEVTRLAATQQAEPAIDTEPDVPLREVVLLAKLRVAADDPMSPDFAEVSKNTLRAAIRFIKATRAPAVEPQDQASDERAVGGDDSALRAEPAGRVLSAVADMTDDEIQAICCRVVTSAFIADDGDVDYLRYDAAVVRAVCTELATRCRAEGGMCPDNSNASISASAPKASGATLPSGVTLKAFKAAHDQQWHVVVEHPFGTSWVKMCDPRDMKLAELLASPAATEATKQPELTVWYGSLPESNGKSNFTAILMRKDGEKWDNMTSGITIDRSEYPDRVRYEADRVRYLIGELSERPDILAYDDEKHSGYKPAATEASGAAVPDEDAAEGIEILDSFIASIEEHGNYSKDATLTFLNQIRMCIAAPAAPEGAKP